MGWTEIVVEIPSEKVDIASSIANMVVPYGIYIEDYQNLEFEVESIAHINLIDDELLKKDKSKALIHIFIKPDENPAEAISFLTQRFDCENIASKIITKGCKMEDWINNWKKYFKPTKVGEKLLICPLWEKDYEKDNRIQLKIEPGLAFGTGTHETTRLCLELIEKYLKPDSDVLDIGCGSGILSVASLLLDAKSAVGIDIDNLAVKTAIENAKINNVDKKFTGICGNLVDKVNNRFDIVLANIVSDVLINLNCEIHKFLKPNSFYIISGIIDTREEDVLNSIPSSLKLIEKISENNWIAMILAN